MNNIGVCCAICNINWNNVSNAASIVTLLLFIFYIIGHIYKINQIKDTLSEKYQFEDDFDFHGPKPQHYVEVSSDVDRIFSISSPVGIKEILIYNVKQDGENPEWIKGDCVKKLSNIKPNEKAYIRVNIPDLYEGCFIELEKKDGIKVSFGVADSGYDGSLIQTKYSLKMTFKSWLYYICS